MDTNIKAIIDYISTNQPLEMKEAFESTIKEKIIDRLDEYKKSMAKNMLDKPTGDQHDAERDKSELPSYVRNRERTARKLRLAKEKLHNHLKDEGFEYSDEELEKVLQEFSDEDIEDFLNEAWDTHGKTVVHPSRRGMFHDVSDEEIQKRLETVKDKMQSHKDEGNTVPHSLRTKFSQLTFALRARGAGGKRWGKI